MRHTHRAAFKNRQPADSRQRQLGVSMIGLLLASLVALFFVVCAFKVGPSYAEFWTISKVADQTAADESLLRGPRSKVYESIQNGFTHNNLWDAKAEERITLKKDGERGMIIKVDYESRTKLFGNIHVVTSFQKEAGNSAQ